MAYGIEFKNNYGDNVLRSKGLLFEHSTGNMVRALDNSYISGSRYYTEMNAVVQQHGTHPANNISVRDQLTGTIVNQTEGGSWAAGPTSQPLVHVATTSRQTADGTYVSGLNYQQSAYIYDAITNTGDTNYHYEIFFKLISAGLHNWSQHYNPYPYAFNSNNKGLHAVVLPSSKNNFVAVPYVVAWNKVPTVGTGYGMTVYDGASDTIFDSRFNAKAIRVKDYVSIPASHFQNCLQNGTTYNYTIRQPISNPYVGGSPQMNVENRVVNYDGFYWYRPTFKMTSSTNLQMYRTIYKFASAVAWGSPPAFNKYQDVLLTILDV